MSDQLRARRGDLICFSSGEYSDYGYVGHFVALEDIREDHFQTAREVAEKRERDNNAAQDAWRRDSGEPYPPYLSVQEMFIGSLIRSGLLVSIAVTEHHIGSYGRIEL